MSENFGHGITFSKHLSHWHLNTVSIRDWYQKKVYLGRQRQLSFWNSVVWKYSMLAYFFHMPHSQIYIFFIWYRDIKLSIISFLKNQIFWELQVTSENKILIYNLKLVFNAGEGVSYQGRSLGGKKIKVLLVRGALFYWTDYNAIYWESEVQLHFKQ